MVTPTDGLGRLRAAEASVISVRCAGVTMSSC